MVQPPPLDEPPIVQPPPPPINKPSGPTQKRNGNSDDAGAIWLDGVWWANWSIFIGLLGWLYCAISTSPDLSLLCYPSIALIGAGITARCLHAFNWRGAKIAGIVATVAVIYLWGRHDTYERTWTSDTFEYTDTYRRWGHQHVYRRIEKYEEDQMDKEFKGLGIWTARGPIAGTGKLHGKWEYIVWKPKIHMETTFYWYGEEISEGEWHLRN